MRGKIGMSSALSVRLLFLVASSLVWAVSPSVLAAADGDAQHLSGLWLMTFDLDPSFGFLPREIKQLSNFITDGNFLATTNLPSLPADPSSMPFPFPKIKLSIGHGEWVRTGNGNFQLEVWRVATCVDPAGCNISTPFYSSGSTAKLDDAIGWAHGKGTVHVDQKSGTMTGTVELQLFAPDFVTAILPPVGGKLTGSSHQP